METNDSKWCVYIHRNKINGKRYVGITSKNPPESRWKSNGSGYIKNKHFWNAIKKYGWENFSHQIILVDEDYEFACKVERCLIKHYKSNDRKYGYNKSIGGERAALGVHRTEEQKKKLSELNKGKVMPQHIRDKISQTEKGRIFPDEVKKKISAANKGKKFTEERKERLRKPHYGQARTKVKCVETNEIFDSLKEAANTHNIKYQSISDVCRGNRPTAGGYHWEYVK